MPIPCLVGLPAKTALVWWVANYMESPRVTWGRRRGRNKRSAGRHTAPCSRTRGVGPARESDYVSEGEITFCLDLDSWIYGSDFLIAKQENAVVTLFVAVDQLHANGSISELCEPWNSKLEAVGLPFEQVTNHHRRPFGFEFFPPPATTIISIYSYVL